MRKNDAFRRAAALLAALSITVSLAAPAFAETYYYIDDGGITITKDEYGKQTVQQGSNAAKNIGDDEEIIITTRDQTITSLESDLEGPAAEDSGFGPVVEDNYQPAAPAQPEDAEEPKDAEQPEGADQPEDAEEPKDADQPENTDRQESADRQEDADRQESAGQQPQQAAPTAADARQESADQQAQPQQAAPAPAAAYAPGFCDHIITVINNAATALKLTLKDVKIDVSDTDDKAALSVQGDGNVTIELDGKNELKSGYDKAGLEKNTSEGTLTLKDDNKEAGSLTAKGGGSAAGIGGSYNGYSANNGTNNIIITGGTVTATGGGYGAGIGGGYKGSGKNIKINGGNETGGQPVDGGEIRADISAVTTGYIHHIIYDEDGTTIKREWWEPERPQPNPESPQPNPDGPNAPAGESNEVDLGTPWLHVETLEGDPLPFDAQQQGRTLRVTTDTLAARLHGNREALEALQEQGVEQIVFVTTLKTTTLSVAELLAEGGSWFALEHNGLVSRQLSAAQAESLKCRMR